MTTTEQIQVLQNAINQLQTQLTNLSTQVSLNSNSLSLHLVDCEDDINTITGRLGVLTAEDVNIHQEIHNISLQTDNNTSRIGNLELEDEDIETRLDTLEAGQITLGNELEEMDAEHHQELHLLSVQIDNNTSKIGDLEVEDVNLDERISVLEEARLSIEQDIIDMDDEHHNEIHLLGLAIDNTNSRITDLEIFKAETPDTVVLTEDEYKALGTPDYNTFYYTYED